MSVRFKRFYLQGDKSISHRVILLSAIADKPTLLSNLNDGTDVKSTIKVLKDLGVGFKKINNSILVLPTKLKRPEKILDCGNSGTTMRLIIGLLSGFRISAELRGDKSLMQRPMDRVTKPINRMGGRVVCGSDGLAPIKILSTTELLNGINYEMPISSAQVKSAILLAGINAVGKTVVKEKIQTRDHTEIWLRSFGVNVKNSGSSVSLRGRVGLKSPGNVSIPGDSTSAFYLAVGGLISKKEIILSNVCLNKRRIKWIDVLNRMGARVEFEELGSDIEPFGNIIVHNNRGSLKSVDIIEDEIPFLIDEIPGLAVVMSIAKGRSTVRGAKELRVKESDRIEAIFENFSKLGVNMEMFDDGFAVIGGSFCGGKVSSFGDHRIAMTMGLCNLVSKDRIYIRDRKSVVISYPNFFKKLKRIIQ